MLGFTHNSPLSDEFFITQMFALVLEGRFREARELLMKHSAHKNNTSDVSTFVVTSDNKSD